MSDHDTTSDRETLSRRAALKKGAVGAAVAGAVWSAPKIEGLTLRPAYAAALSGGAVSGTSNSGSAPLPDLVNLNSPIEFTGLLCEIVSVTVNLDISHTWMGDLEIRLTSPAGTTILLVNNECNFFPRTTGMLITLDDGAASPVGSDCTNPDLYTGTFQPVQALSAFDGEDPNGTWTMNFLDTQNIDAGTLNNASITITAA